MFRKCWTQIPLAGAISRLQCLAFKMQCLLSSQTNTNSCEYPRTHTSGTRITEIGSKFICPGM